MIVSETASLYENKIIFTATNYNIFYSIDIESGRIEIVDSLPGERIFAKRLIGNTELYEDKLFFVPFNAKKVWVYFIKERKWKSINLKYESQETKFWNSCIYGRYLYMIPCRYPALVRIDLETYDVIEDSSCLLPSSMFKESAGYFFSDYIVDEGKLIIASCSSNYILKYDFATCDKEWIMVGSKDNQYVAVATVGNDYWLAPRKNTPIVKYSSGKYIEYELPNDFKDVYNFLGIRYDGDIILYGINKKNVKINVNNEKMSILEKDEGYSFYGNVSKDISVEVFKNGRVIITEKAINKRVYADLNNIDIKSYLLNKCEYDCLSEMELFSEGDSMELELYIDLLKRR